MWPSGKGIANASVLWRGARRSVTAAPFAGPATLIWGQVSTHWGLIASHGSFRPYALRIRPGTTPHTRIIPDLEELLKSYAVHASGLDIAPAVLFDFNAPPIETSDSGPGDEFHRLLGFSSDSETLKIYFKPKSPNPWWGSLGPIKLSKLYLRDICQCSRCVCPSTGQKNFATCDIDPLPRVLNPETENIRLSADGSLEITWKADFLTGDNHTSVYPEELLTRLASGNRQASMHAHPGVITWDAAEFERGMDSRDIAFNDWMKDGAEFAQAVLSLHRYGLVFMHGVPGSQHSVRMIAERLGNLQSTIHGLTWDAISEPGAEISGCADGRLHQDLLYSQDQPQIQFHHYLENDWEGNVSLFSDGFNGAGVLKAKDRRAYLALSTKLVNYSYQKEGHYLSSRRRVIQLGKGKGDKVVSIAWSPAFQGPFLLNDSQETSHEGTGDGPEDGALWAWSRAARVFRDVVESPEHMIAYRARPGDCVIFDKRRILHGSKQLALPAGRKHIRGAYVGPQTLRSTLTRLIEKGLVTPFSGKHMHVPGLSCYDPDDHVNSLERLQPHYIV